MDIRAALAQAAEIGPFFAVATEHRAPGWQPFAAFIDDEAVRRERVATAREFVAVRAGVPVSAIDERATASIQHLGTVARIVSPLLAVAAMHRRAPSVTPANLHWRAMAGGPVEFAITAGQDAPIDVALASVVEPLGEAFAATWRLSPHVIRGNVASALAGAATMLAKSRPHLAAEAVRNVRRLLEHRYLHGAGSWPEHGSFRRTNCCLFYRMPAAGICADCVLTHAPITTR